MFKVNNKDTRTIVNDCKCDQKKDYMSHRGEASPLGALRIKT